MKGKLILVILFWGALFSRNINAQVPGQGIGEIQTGHLWIPQTGETCDSFSLWTMWGGSGRSGPYVDPTIFYPRPYLFDLRISLRNRMEIGIQVPISFLTLGLSTKKQVVMEKEYIPAVAFTVGGAWSPWNNSLSFYSTAGMSKRFLKFDDNYSFYPGICAFFSPSVGYLRTEANMVPSTTSGNEKTLHISADGFYFSLIAGFEIPFFYSAKGRDTPIFSILIAAMEHFYSPSFRAMWDGDSSWTAISDSGLTVFAGFVIGR